MLVPVYEKAVDSDNRPSLPPSYSAAIARDPHTRPAADFSISSGEINGNGFAGRPGGVQNVLSQNPGGRRDASEYENVDCPWFGKDCSVSRSTVGKLVLIFMAMLTGVYITINTVRCRGNNTSRTNPGDDGSSNVQSPDMKKTCAAGIYKNSAIFDFIDTPEFSLVQFVQNVGNHSPNPVDHLRIGGEINVRPAAKNADFKLRVELMAYASDPQIMGLEPAKKTKIGLTIKTPNCLPHRRPDFPGQKPCISMGITIWVSSGIDLQNFGIDTQSFSITFHPELNYTIAHRTTLHTVSGAINMPASAMTRTRETIIHSTSGAVTGTYPLYDLLSITTLSGLISISVSPQPSLSSSPDTPATLHLYASSASIHVTTPSILTPTLLPPRNYTSSITSSSGSLTATLLHTTTTTLRSSSGSIQASVYPHGNPTLPSHLLSHAQSGSNHITLHNSLSHPIAPLRALSASHHSISGSLNLVYPSRWEGNIFGRSVSGRLNVNWSGVRILREGRGVVEGVRGKEGGGKLVFEGISGSADLRGGEEWQWEL